MKNPASLNVLGTRVPVSYRSLGENRGEFDAEQMTVLVDPGDGQRTRARTLVHERMHAFLLLGGHETKMKFEDEDLAGIAEAFVEDLIRNDKKLLEYLKEVLG